MLDYKLPLQSKPVKCRANKKCTTSRQTATPDTLILIKPTASSDMSEYDRKISNRDLKQLTPESMKPSSLSLHRGQSSILYVRFHVLTGVSMSLGCCAVQPDRSLTFSDMLAASHGHKDVDGGLLGWHP